MYAELCGELDALLQADARLADVRRRWDALLFDVAMLRLSPQPPTGLRDGHNQIRRLQSAALLGYEERYAQRPGSVPHLYSAKASLRDAMAHWFMRNRIRSDGNSGPPSQKSSMEPAALFTLADT
jgi:hypothetical protein